MMPKSEMKHSPPSLSKNMTLQQFDNGYWYAKDIKAFAKTIGIKSASRLRKDELEGLIRQYLKTGKVSQSKRKLNTAHGKKDTDKGLSLNLPIEHYTNNATTKNFLIDEAKNIDPNFQLKSGAMYRINRWRENEINQGNKITYGDLVTEFVRLNSQSHFQPMEVTRYINFLAEFEKNEKGVTRADAIAAWHEVKKFNTPKTYSGWKSEQAKSSSGD